jgi:hypothetical protein
MNLADQERRLERELASLKAKQGIQKAGDLKKARIRQLQHEINSIKYSKFNKFVDSSGKLLRKGYSKVQDYATKASKQQKGKKKKSGYRLGFNSDSDFFTPSKEWGF